jgi:uncharacterized membrane protein
MVGISVWGALAIPVDARVPIHFDLHGRTNGFAGKWAALLPLPLVAASVLLGFWAARSHLRSSARAVAATAVGTTAVQAAIHLLLVLGAARHPVDVGLGALLAQSMLFMVVGNYLPTTRRNGLFGIRMPWTLRSDEVWRRTHALGGRLFVALGVATLIGALFSTAVGHLVLMGGLALLVLGTGIYSYHLSHKLSGG